MQQNRVVVVTGDKHRKLWDLIIEAQKGSDPGTSLSLSLHKVIPLMYKVSRTRSMDLSRLVTELSSSSVITPLLTVGEPRCPLTTE